MEWTAEQLGVLLPAAAAQMRGPLSSLILAMQEALPEEEREASPEKDRKAARLDQSYYVLLRFVENLSNTGWLTGTRKPRLENCDLIRLVSGVCVESACYIEEQGRTFTFSVPPGEQYSAADREALRTALYQLLSNALKFTPPGGSIRVELKFSGGKHGTLTVSNSGEGLGAELMEFLSDRCENQDRKVPPPHGLGLGLPLCRAIVEAHGGRMLVHSGSGGGCQVTLSLPLRREEHTMVRDCSSVVYDAGFSPALLGLADALPSAAFRLCGQD